MIGPIRTTAAVERDVWACPICKHVCTTHHSLKNGTWAFEPAENFGFGKSGMVCAEWDDDRLTMYYHSPEDIERGEVIDDYDIIPHEKRAGLREFMENGDGE